MTYKEFEAAASRLAGPLSDIQKERFAAMDALYRDWNAKINVISRKDMDGLYDHHVLHSLAIAAYLRSALPQEYEAWQAGGVTVLDLGTGGYSNVIMGFVNSNINPNTVNGVVDGYNGNKVVLFAYRDDPLSPFVPVTLRIGYVGPDDEFEGESTYKDSKTPAFPWAPNETRSVGDLLYHEIPLRSGNIKIIRPVHYRLSANGYVTAEGYAGRFKADNNPMLGSSLNSKIKEGTPSTTLSGKFNGNYKCTVSIPSVSGSSGGVQLAAGAEHTITVTSGSTENNSSLTFVSIKFAAKNNKLLLPAEFLNEDGTAADVEKYMLTDNTYLWRINNDPNNPIHTATLKLVAPASNEICISELNVWDYRVGTFFPVN